MGLNKKRDGRYVVGIGIENGNEYKGSAGYRDMVIQYTADGATDKSMEYLEYLRDYALYHSEQGNPVVPPNVSVWLSTANTMKAVEADDVSVDGSNFSIGAISWDGSNWTFGEPTSGGSGSSLPPYTSSDIGKVLTVGEAEAKTVVVVPEQTVNFTVNGRTGCKGTVSDIDAASLVDGASVVVKAAGTSYFCTYASGEISDGTLLLVVDDGAISISGVILSGPKFVSATASVPPTTTTVIVPEQTVTIVEGGSYLTNADFSSVSVGTSGTMTIDADSFPVVAQDLDGMIGFMAEDGGESYAIATDGTDVFFETSITGTHTVSLAVSVPSVGPKWEAANGVYLVHVDGETMTIVENFDDVAEAFTKMPVYLDMEEDGLLLLSTKEGTKIVGYIFQALPIAAGTAGKLTISKVAITSDGNISFRTYTADITQA